MKLSVKLLASVGLFSLTLASSSALAAADEKLRAAAEQAQPAVIESLHDMVLIESGSSDVEGLKKMADYTEARLKALGARTERRKTTKGAGADMVIGTFEGSGSKKLMLIAHMDTSMSTASSTPSPTRSTATGSMDPASPTTRAASP